MLISEIRDDQQYSEWPLCGNHNLCGLVEACLQASRLGGKGGFFWLLLNVLVGCAKC